jgi:hypothetical protein
MDRQSVAEYVAGRVKTGMSKESVKEELLSVGWSEEEADIAYRDGLVALGAPLPNEGSRGALVRKSSAADIVINLFSFILLGIVVTALGTLFFSIIERYFPDALDVMNAYGDASNTSSIHYAIAALIIGFPLYFAAMRLWFRKFREDEGRTESRLSKWLTYIVLLAASVTIALDLITVVFTLLQGEITVRFFLKAITILSLAGIIFGFYFLERRKIQYKKDIPRAIFQRFGWAVTGVVACGIVLGFFAGGSPETARKQTFDLQRSSDLSSLANCIESFAGDRGQLPASLTDLKQSSAYSYCAGSMQDPETKTMYEYRVVTPSRIDGPAHVGEFELCATFSLASDQDQRSMTRGDNASAWYIHDAGRNCDIATAQLTVKTTLPGDIVLPAVPTR